MEDIIRKYVMIEDYDMTIALSTDNPYDIIDYLNENKHIKGAYFLDIDLGTDMNGVQLGAKIRQQDIFSRIIFVTTHSELMSLTFTYKVEAMDYILKDDPDLLQIKVQECLHRINDYYTAADIDEEDRIKLTIDNQLRVFLLKDVMFFETSEKSHKLRLHLTNAIIELYGKLNELEELSQSLVRVHKSYLINKDNIERMDSKHREVTMMNGETCLISARKLKLLK